MKPSTTPPLLDLLAALGVLCIVGSLLVPLPLPLLDLLLTLNLGLALLLLATALLLTDPLRLSSFPTLLLVSTLFRLALNVSSTRQILGQGEAGQIIEAFGSFVVGGSYVVGAVVFLILTVIQLVVVAKGAERVAEVGARFTLDGLPGKQLSIDADLRSGSCSQSEGARRRAILEDETRFYGALDGAMKFVKGDAIAGLVVTAVNIVGGLGIGMGLQGLPLGEAAARFTLLSIGDGLVSQLPALLSSVAAGIVVTRVARSGSSGGSAGELVRQLAEDPRALGLSATLLALLGLVPGLPLLPFFLCAGLLGAVAAGVSRRRGGGSFSSDRLEMSNHPAGERTIGKGSELRTLASPAGSMAAPAGAPSVFLLELGRPEASPEYERLQREVVPILGRELGAQLGIRLPPIATRAGIPGHYRLRLHGAVLCEGVLPTRPVLLSSPDEARLLQIEGRPCEVEGRPALEIDAAMGELAKRCGLIPLDPAQVLVRSLRQALVDSAAEWLTLQHTVDLIEGIESTAPSLAEEVRSRLGPSLLHRVLQSLLEERVPLRPLDRVLEALLLIDASRLTSEGTEAVRRALGRQLVRPHLEDGVLSVLLLDPFADAHLREALCPLGDAVELALGPDQQQHLVEQVRALGGERPGVLLAPGELRGPLSRVLRGGHSEGPRPVVLAFEELPPGLRLRPLGRISLETTTGDRRPLQPRFESPASPAAAAIGA